MTTPGGDRAVLLTPPGRGAVASILVEGSRAIEHVAQLFHGAAGRPLAEQPPDKIVVGRWQSPEAGEEVVVCRRADDNVEIHCHGGQAASQAILAALEERGCRPLDWQSWIRETSTDPWVAEARIALSLAPTERTAAILCDQLAGALDRALEQLMAAIAADRAELASQTLDALLARAELGRHLVDPWRVVLAGRPNVGKSSLVNALCGYQRAIVHPTAGTTRDVVTAQSAVDGWPVELADTAGLRASAAPLEAAGIQLARERLASADLVVLVFDASSDAPEDQRLLADWPEALVVSNKCDLADPPRQRPSSHQAIYTSALTGEGLERLEREIGRRLVPRPPEAGAAVPFGEAQTRALEHIGQALRAGARDEAGRLAARLLRQGC